MNPSTLKRLAILRGADKYFTHTKMWGSVRKEIQALLFVEATLTVFQPSCKQWLSCSGLAIRFIACIDAQQRHEGEYPIRHDVRARSVDEQIVQLH